MKNNILILLSVFIISCSNNVKTIDITLTSKSIEASNIVASALFFKEGFTDGRIYTGELVEALEKALKIDPNFEFAKAIYGDIPNNLKNSDRRSYIESAYSKIENVSEIEKAFIQSIYFNKIEGNKVKAASVLNEIFEKYPEYYYIGVYNGFFQNTIMQNPKEAQVNWNNALKINPNANIAKLLLAQLHFVTTPGFYRLEKDEIDLTYAANIIKEVEQMEPENPEPQRLLGNIYRVKGEFDSSLKSYKKAIDLSKNKKGSRYAQLFLISGHVYLFKGEYEKARQYYLECLKYYDNPNFESFTRLWLSNTFLYEKKYKSSILAIDEIQKDFENYDLDPLTKKSLLYACAFEKFVAYGHSQMKQEALKSIGNMIKLNGDMKNIRLSKIKSESEKRNIELQIESADKFNRIWYSILFGEYQIARELLKEYTLLSGEYLTYDSKAMVGFYKLSGYLNLMEGNIQQSISFYEQIPKELLEEDNYQLYFYALAKKANGNNKRSEELFNYLANYNFAGWQNSIIRPLAVEQIKN